MGKQHVAATYDALLALDAEGIAAAALLEAEQRLAHIGGQFRVGLVVSDDVAGGWTNRYAAEMGRFNGGPLLKRGWIAVGFWTGEQPSGEKVRERVLLSVFRMAYMQCFGPAETLRQMLLQEGLVAAFAGLNQPFLEPDEVAYTRDIITPHLDTTEYPTQFAALFGDEAAAMFGYPALGLSPWAGLALASHDAQQCFDAPEAVLVK
jgi:hypothetical protein